MRSPLQGNGIRLPHRVVLIDPRPERRAITRQLVDRHPILSVVGVAETLDEAVTEITGRHATVALMEIQMPVADGLATIGALRERFDRLCIIVCSFHNDPPTRREAERLGADGYLTKPLDVAALVKLLVTPHEAHSNASECGPPPHETESPCIQAAAR